MDNLFNKLNEVTIESEDIREDELESISEEDLDKFSILLQQFGKDTESLSKFINKNPIRIAQRLLRLYGDRAENEVTQNFPNTVDRDVLVFNIKQQRKRYSGQQWSKWGVDRKY